MTDYTEFLARKAAVAPMRGVSTVPPLAAHLFPFQRACVDFLLRAGSGGLFLDTGLGKTACELEWCRHAAAATNGRALILTPLAVARQIEREGKRWGYEIRVIREQSETGDGINVCNYDRLEKLDTDAFGAVALDESSILKSFTGKTTRALIQAFAGHRFRLSATATPAPNDHMELGQHAEFCGVMSSVEMLSRFFINDTSQASQHWRLKNHGVESFWDWMSSWCRMASMPSDLGDSDEGFVLPPLNVSSHRSATVALNAEGGLFGDVVMSATEMHKVKRQTSGSRAEAAAALVMTAPQEHWLLWCDTNYEADALLEALKDVPHVREVRGSDSLDWKEDALEWFTGGRCLCGNASTKRTAYDGLQATPNTPNASSLTSHREHQKKTEPTCVLTTGDIPSVGIAAPSSASIATPSVASDTQKTETSEKSTRQRSSSGRAPIQQSDSPSGSESTASPSPTTRNSSRRKAADARSVDAPMPASGAAGDFMSITAMPADSFAGCSAPPATLGSESSRTIRIVSSEPQCTCGHLSSGGRVLICKPSQFGYGLNLQHCARTIFVGRSFSYESWYQAIRRLWRFGQQRQVECHVVVAAGEDSIGRVIDRKAGDHDSMKLAMTAAMRRAVGAESAVRVAYNPTHEGRLPCWIK